MDLKNLFILPENSAEGLKTRRETCQGYLFIYENANEKLPLKVATSLLSGSKGHREGHLLVGGASRCSFAR